MVSIITDFEGLNIQNTKIKISLIDIEYEVFRLKYIESRSKYYSNKIPWKHSSKKYLSQFPALFPSKPNTIRTKSFWSRRQRKTLLNILLIISIPLIAFILIYIGATYFIKK